MAASWAIVKPSAPSGDRRPGGVAGGLDQRGPRHAVVPRDPVVLDPALAREEGDAAGFVVHVLHGTCAIRAESVLYGQDRPRARAAGGAPGPPVGAAGRSSPPGSASTRARCGATSSRCARLGIPVEAERGPAGGYRLRPGYRMPPLLFTTGEATAVALGLLAARRDGLDADGALAKLHRVLPDRVRLRVEALEQTLQVTGRPRSAAPPQRRAPAAARRGRGPRAARPGALHVERGRRVRARAEPVRPRRPRRALVRARARPRARRAARPARRPLRRGPARRPGRSAAAGLRRRRVRRAARWPACRGRTRSRWCSSCRSRPRRRASRPRSPSSRPTASGRCCACAPSRSTGWPALLAGMGCDFTVRRPDELRASLGALADRLSLAARSGGRSPPARGC